MRRGLAGLLLALLVLSGCGDPPPPRGLTASGVVGDKDPTLQVWLGPAGSLHPHVTSPHLAATLFPPLVHTDPDTRLPSWGPEAPEALMQSISSADLRRWELTIKAGWTWHDGTPVTAADLERGWRAAMAAGLPLASNLSDVRARDDVTLAFSLAAPFAQVPQLLAHPTFVALPSLADDDADGFARDPMGYGPLRVAARQDDTLTLEAVAGHPLGDRVVATVVRVSLAAAPGVEDDVVVGADGDLVPPAGPADGSRTQLLRVPGRQLAYLGIPLTVPGFADPDVRRALSAAIDRERLATDLMDGAVLPADRLVGPGLARDPETVCRWCRQDAQLARSLWPEEPPSLTLWFAGDGGHEPVIRAIAEDWRDVLDARGIELASEPGTAFLDRITTSGVEGPFRLTWQADVAASVRVIEPLLGPRGTANDVRYRSTALADLLVAAGRERDIPTAQKLYGAAETLVLDDMPLIPLWFSTVPVSSRPQVRGLHLDGEGRVQLWRLR